MITGCRKLVTDEEGAGDHVGISPERDTFPQRTARGPRPGSDTSWRTPPPSRVTLQAVLLIGGLGTCLGLLLGTTWTVQAFQPRLGRRAAEERRKLNDEWLAVRAARRQQVRCSRCAGPLPERDWYFAPATVEERDDD